MNRLSAKWLVRDWTRSAASATIAFALAGCAAVSLQPPESAVAIAPAPACSVDASPVPPLGQAALLLASAWGVTLDGLPSQGTISLESRMPAWYAIDTFSRGAAPAVNDAVAATDRRAAAEAWVRALSMLSFFIERGEHLTAGPALPVPEELAEAIRGEVLLAEHVEGLGWIVVGSEGDNRYDMSVIAGVFDCGGDDRYMWGATAPKYQAIVDLAGDDRYAAADPFAEGVVAGPAIAVDGIAFIDDHAGDDQYISGRTPPVTAMRGLAILLDRGGDDWLGWDMSTSGREAEPASESNLGGLALLVKPEGSISLLTTGGEAGGVGNRLRATALIELTAAGWVASPPVPPVPMASAP
ncbi:MAG: hypothetical protein O2819_06280 [Planctomycetota bacterium]|nr:hypothetical protein [Planctomycetota bacterium]MDA1106140.1 hypothetical protein [Planctomycetota bacterium]